MVLPSFLNIAQQFNISIIFILALLALSMSFLWGYAGILSFGQTAFFGLGGYGFAVLALNLGETTFSLFAAILLAMLFAAVLGYFMIYGRISDIYLSVITLVVTLIFEKGDQVDLGRAIRHRQGAAERPERHSHGTVDARFPGTPPRSSASTASSISSAALLVLVYVGLRLLLTTPFGRVLVGIRENTRRIELLGYDSRRYKLAAFVICGGIAALSGVLFAVWNNFVAPEMFGLKRAAEVIVWVIVGGKSTLIGPDRRHGHRADAEDQPRLAGGRRMAAADPRRRADAGRSGVPRGPAAGHRRCHRLALPARSRERRMNGAPVLADRRPGEALRRRARHRRRRLQRSPKASCAASSAPTAPARARSSRW